MRPWQREEGISLVWLAMMLTLLIGVAGFAIDLGWLYLNTTRAQEAVDSAALAGVVNLPGFIAKAELDAEDAVHANGFDPAGLGVTPLADNKLYAELQAQVPTFFVKLLGFDTFTIRRDATAEYVKPVPLGNPANCFGCPSIGSSWAAISSQYIHKEHGDPYSTRCRVPSSSSSCSSTNSDYNRGGAYAGYYYGIEVFGGSEDLTVDIYDAMFNARNQDDGPGDFSIGGGGGGPITNYTFHMVDDTPHDPTNNPMVSGCSWSLNPNDGNFYRDRWRTLCSLNGSLTPGIYVLHVWTSGTGIASNQYSVMADTAVGLEPRVFAINDMSIWSNDLTSHSQLYLAEIEPSHAGKKLELQFYDPGDASEDSFMTVLSPTGAVPTCSWTIWNHNLTAQTQSPGSGPCTWQTTDESRGSDPRVFNEQWIVAGIDLPDDPASMCGTDCFWKMDLDLSEPFERTTWRARVIGNPVRLVPNEPVP